MKREKKIRKKDKDDKNKPEKGRKARIRNKVTGKEKE